MTRKHRFLVSAVTFSLCCSVFSVSSVRAEDCVGTLPGAPCTLTEDTTAPLFIGNGITLTVGASVEIQDEINGEAADGDGTIQTNSGGVTVQQTAAIGETTAIENLIIGNDDTWVASANITTDDDGTDINLGAGDGDEVLNLISGLTITGEIDGNSGDIVNVGQDGNGGVFQINSDIETVTLNVVSGSLTLTDDAGGGAALSDVTVSDGASLIIQEDLTTSSVLINDGTISLQSDSQLRANTYSAGTDSGQFIFGIDSATGTVAIGNFQVDAGGPVDLSDDFASFTFEKNTDVIDTTTLTDVVIGNGGATAAPVINNDYYLYNFEFQQSGSNLDLAITRRDLGDVASNENNLKASQMLMDTLGDTPDLKIKEIQRNAATASSREEYNDVLESIQPGVDASAARLANFVSDRTTSMVQSRLDSIARSKKAEKITGVSSGNISSQGEGNVVQNKTRVLAERRLRYLKARESRLQNRVVTVENNIYEREPLYERERGIQVWAQAFGGTGEQSARDNIDGYDFDTAGVAFGADTGDMDRKFIIGAMLAYANSDVDSEGANSTETSMDSYQLGFYGSYNFDEGFFTNASVAYGLHDISATRFNVGGTGDNAVAEYDSEQISAYFEVGKDFEYRKNVTITPSLTMNYSRVSFEDYRERGAGAANLVVEQEAVNSLDIGPRVKAEYTKLLENEVVLKPEAELAYRYDVIGDEIDTVSYLQGTDTGAGGVQFSSNGFDAQNHTIDVGVGLSVGKDNWQIKTDYDYQVKEDFSAHSGLIRANYNF